MQPTQPTIKIFVTYKEKHPMLKSEIFTPIQTGRAIADKIFEDMIGDDTGDNVSKENPKYNELSAQYWVWKNYDKIGNPDYVGFTHYRRHFIFDEPNDLAKHEPWIPKSYVYRFKSLDNNYLNMMKDDDIRFICSKCECITLKPYDVHHMGDNSIRERFSKLPQQNLENFDLFINTLYEEAPEYKAEIEYLQKSGVQYLCNMFIMKKELFFEYSKFAFNILQKVDEKIDSQHYSEKGLRYLGFLGEMLLGIFVMHWQARNKKIKELNGSIILHNDTVDEIKPAFSSVKNVITTYADENDVPYLSVWLNSLISHANKSKNYDIVILEKTISDANKESLLSLCADKKNISLRFFNTKQYFVNEPEDLRVHKERCYKICAAEIFKDYSRVIYVDWNCLFAQDVAELKQINLKDNVIGACLDYNMNGFFGANHSDWKEYCAETLQMNDVYAYVNASVLIIDVKKFNEQNIAQQCFDMLMMQPVRNREQDVINSVLQGKIFYLSELWNVPTLLPLGKQTTLYTMEYDLQVKYAKAVKQAKIIQYVSARKPWIYPNSDMALVWWQYARQTPFYEEILARLIDFRISQKDPQIDVNVAQLRQEFVNIHFPNINNHFAKNEKDMKLLFVMAHPVKFRLKKWCYGIKKAFAFGKRHKKYQNKFNAVKQLIKEAKIYEKQLAGI